MATTSSYATGTTGTTAATAPTAPKESTALIMSERMLLAELQAINDTLSQNCIPIKSQEIWNFLLQFFGILAAIIFGVFSILAWIDANKANSIASGALNLAIEANTLALLAYCLSSNDTDTAGVCLKVRSGAAAYITSILTSLPISNISGNVNTDNGNSGNGSNVNGGALQNSSPARLIAGYVIGPGILLLCIIVWLPMQTYKEKVRRNRVCNYQPTPL